MSLASFFATCRYRHAEQSFGYMQFDADEGGFVVPMPASLVKRANSVVLLGLLTLYGSAPVISRLTLKRIEERD